MKVVQKRSVDEEGVGVTRVTTLLALVNRVTLSAIGPEYAHTLKGVRRGCFRLRPKNARDAIEAESGHVLLSITPILYLSMP